MNKTIEILTEKDLPVSERRQYLRRFAFENGWQPSDEFSDYPLTRPYANGHLLVEHGLNISGVVTFLKNNRRFSDLTYEEKLKLVSVSYNNLVEWHFFPYRDGLSYVFNRTSKLKDSFFSINDDPDFLRVETFEKVNKSRPYPELKSIDYALIEILSAWKRKLAVEIGEDIKNHHISTLFNSILFIRATEDQKRRLSNEHATILLSAIHKDKNKSKTLVQYIKNCLRDLDIPNNSYTKELINFDNLEIFNQLNYQTIEYLFNDFYKNPFAPYEYDFSLISKHALSRIYERYVSLLRVKESPQLRLFAELPEEISNRSLGSFYTPQYIARFFARYIRENHTPNNFRTLKTIDPSCGSGIFLRTILEMQCDQLQDININVFEDAKNVFSNVLGIDVDENACYATRLSLTLLHLVLIGKLPIKIKIENEDAITYFENNPNLKNSFDLVITNPPFIKWQNMKASLRNKIKGFLPEVINGKPDLYLAMLKIGMSLLKPDGFLLYVLPHSFLYTENAKIFRKQICDSFWVRAFVDLSEISVFRGIGSYVVLLIIQKRSSINLDEPKATIVKCSDFEGHALQKALEKKTAKTEFYEVYEVNQSVFSGDPWNILPPEQSIIFEKLNKMNVLDNYLTIRTGFSTGADNVFIRDSKSIPKSEKSVYRPFLPDREMQKYLVPKIYYKVVFYPYINDKKINEIELKNKFPETWQYLLKNMSELKKRKPVQAGNTPWWCPTRPRKPENIFRKKIIAPHLIALPRFSLDIEGKYAVTHSPILYPKSSDYPFEIFLYFLALMNSSIIFWQISNYSHKYGRGYLMLEPKTLEKLFVPDLADIPIIEMKKLYRLVNKCIDDNENLAADIDLDNLVADLYKLTPSERKIIGM